MTQLAADNESLKGPLAGTNLVAALLILASEIMYLGGMMAIDSAREAQMASDTLGLRVVGVCNQAVDNTADGESVNPPSVGVWRMNNSATYAIGRGMVGQTCYVEDDNTVGASSTNLVVAGLIVDVDGSGVWVDFSPTAMAQARAGARLKVVSVTDDATVTAAQCFQGNVVLACDKATGLTLTLPTAVAGYRLGVQRIDGTAAHDVVVTAAAGDKVRGSAAAGTITNTTDAVSAILWLETASATDWVDAAPLAPDRAVWAASA